MNVLGTPIQAGAAAARAVLISDLHVGDPAGGVLASLAGAVQHARDHADALFVLGDLFDSYVCRAQVRVGVWRDVAQCFSSAAAAGLRIVVMVGNRDFLLGGEFARASGAELVHGGYRAEIGGLDTLLLHGDELCQNDLPYQRAKRWLRHPVTRALARNLPLALARGLAAFVATFAWTGTWSLARPPEYFILGPVLLVALSLWNWSCSLREVEPSETIIDWAPAFLAAPLVLSLLYHVLAFVALTGRGASTPGYYLHVLAAPLGLAFALGWRGGLL